MPFEETETSEIIQENPIHEEKRDTYDENLITEDNDTVTPKANKNDSAIVINFY
jgi:hypothetical protein